jgi:hypothetical protein
VPPMISRNLAANADCPEASRTPHCIAASDIFPGIRCRISLPLPEAIHSVGPFPRRPSLQFCAALASFRRPRLHNALLWRLDRCA